MEALLDKKNYSGLDIGKFLCALLILLYHYFSEHGPVPKIVDESLSLYAIAVALFMVISGFLLFNKLENIKGTNNRWKVVKKQVLRILTIYGLWSIPYLIYTVACWDWNSINITFVLWQIQSWVFNSTFYTIWFMPMLALGLLLTFWLTEKLPERFVIILAVLMYIIGSLSLTYKHFGFMIPGFYEFSTFADTWLGGSRGWLFFAFPLLMVGRRMVNNKARVKWPMMLGLSAIFVVLLIFEALILRYFAGHTGIDMTIMMIPSTYCILGFLISIDPPSNCITLTMRRMSTLIFMTQRLFLTVIPHYLSSELKKSIFENNIYIGAIIVGTCVIVFCFAIIALSKKVKFFRKLY